MQSEVEVQTFYLCDVHGYSAALEACCVEAEDIGWMEVKVNVQD